MINARRWFLSAFVLCAHMIVGASGAEIILKRVPNGGIQPQIQVDERGSAHLIYFSGDPRAGVVYYAKAVTNSFSEPIRVNTSSNAMAIGTVRGAHLALGKNGRPHVSWMGARPVKTGDAEHAPLWYTRLDDAGSRFASERNVITYAHGLDGGGSVAADPEGNVYVAWHGNPPGNEAEAGRAVFLTRSRDDGETFARETMASSPGAGSCACCGMRIAAAAGGAVAILYRNADEKDARSQTLLASRDHGATFTTALEDPWNITTCPMSTAFLHASGDEFLAGWETKATVRFATFTAASPEDRKLDIIAPEGATKRKHPAIARNRAGETLYVWTEGTAWMKGGNVAWQLFDKNGKPTAQKGTAPGIPTWSLAAPYADQAGNFVIMH